MKRRIAETIVRYRILILILTVLAAGWSATRISATHINYDLTKYLSENTMTRKSLEIMKEEFGSSEQLRLVFSGQDGEAMDGYAAALKDIEEIRTVQYRPGEDEREADGTTWQMVTVTLADCDTAELVTRLRGMFPEAGGCLVAGSAASQLDIQKSVGAEIPGVMAVAAAVVLAVLLLTSHAWLEPLVLLIVFALSILINMGTNFLFPDVSFITFAVCPILQLALSIDYAIMLLHTWNALRDEGMSPEEAMTGALTECFMRITSSAVTTIAGLMSLLFMSFTIGFDIGMVLSKGIVISMLNVFLLMPSVTLLLAGPLGKTRHAPVRLGGEKQGRLIWTHRKAVAAVMLLVVACGAFLTTRNVYSFTESASMRDSETDRVNRIFGASNPLVLLVPGGPDAEDFDRQRELVRELQAAVRDDGSPAVKEVKAMVTTGEAALKEYTPAEVAEMTGIGEDTIQRFFDMMGSGNTLRADRLLDAAALFAGDNGTVRELKEALDTARGAFIGKHYDRILAEPSFTAADPDFRTTMDRVLDAASSVYGDDWYITGNAMSVYDIGSAFHGDLMKVNLITLAAILLVVMASFRAARLPVLLVLVIEGAIWVTMGINRITGQPIFFISYLICLSIQMGATIDYGILLCDQYRTLRRKGAAPKEALSAALGKALPTVATSGIILVTAGFIIGKMCSIYYISSIGLLVSRGALISGILVVTLLPALLALCDRMIIREPFPLKRQRRNRA
ncbi:MAG: MMPL family transporter [Clostridiales bacterium]|nr:MMPL family transporter [Clostridiales bacterium]